MWLARLRERKLEQTCTACGRMEAAGSHCTGCLRVMDPDEWYRNGDSQLHGGWVPDLDCMEVGSMCRRRLGESEALTDAD